MITNHPLNKVKLLSVESDDNRYLYKNGDKWWVSLTIRINDISSERIRFSTKETDIVKARGVRNRIIKAIKSHQDNE